MLSINALFFLVVFVLVPLLGYCAWKNYKEVERKYYRRMAQLRRRTRR